MMRWLRSMGAVILGRRPAIAASEQQLRAQERRALDAIRRLHAGLDAQEAAMRTMETTVERTDQYGADLVERGRGTDA